MSDTKLDKKLLEQFQTVTTKKFTDQGIFFLNAYWKEHSEHAEDVWKFAQKFIELDKAAWSALGKDSDEWKMGADVDEFYSHKFLETFGETMTVIKLRETLRAIDIDNNKRMSLIEYVIFKYTLSVKELLERPQGTNEALVKAQQALEEVQKEIEKIEKQKKKLEKESEGTGVKANAAKAALAQLLAADPTELNKAIVTATAAVRKAQKQEGEIGRAVQQECRDRSRMPSSA
eukprot:TRINITY_DN842_c0_g1_i18.p1 TRINITY_DN842_c0_g1~~TRINITY_DN842_c0_g1_i18.p1  ORF type:complete len:232 (-),score=55.68 TRINITY_DN842_c0_g1_i18:11-706(-)